MRSVFTVYVHTVATVKRKTRENAANNFSREKWVKFLSHLPSEINTFAKYKSIKISGQKVIITQ